MMKADYIKNKYFLYLLLFIYVISAIKPVTPILSDVFAHLLYESEHLATVHFENGKYHVHAELSKEAGSADEKKSKSSAPLSEDLQTSLHEIPLTLFSFCSRTYAGSAYQTYSTESILSSCSSVAVPPPKS